MSNPWSKYIGIPFADGGRSAQGVDCYGLLWLILRDHFGIEIPSFSCYKDAADSAVPDLLCSGSHDSDVWTPADGHARAGDALVFRVGLHPRHVAMAIDSTRMIHVEERTLSCIEYSTCRVWERRLWGRFRHVQLA